MTLQTEVIDAAKKYVEEAMANGIEEKYPYHNLQHTLDVVQAVEEVGKNSDLSDDDLETVLLAAWFHDVGYSSGGEDHEQESIKQATEILKEYNFSKERITKIAGCIAATKMPQNPSNLLEKVICDADMYHLSTDQFFERSRLLKEEMDATAEKPLTEEEWLDKNIDFLKNHTYFTHYGQIMLGPRKEKNFKKLKKQAKGEEKVDAKYVQKLEKELLKSRNKLEADKEKTPTRGIETMFRITSKNHLTLSGMADNKANIMISVNSIILSILVSVLFRRLEDSPNLVIPALVLTLVCLVTIVFAILATRPNVSSGTFTHEDIRSKKTNLLFFGNFHSMNLDNYMWGMKEMMKDNDFLYGSLIKDIYFLGAVLGLKYKLLRYSYTVFMFGFIISVLLFILAYIFPNFFTL